MKDHATLLGILYISFSVVCLFAAIVVYVAVVGGGMLSGDHEAIYYTSRVGTAVAALLFALSIPGFVAAYGLLKRRRWGRFFALVLGGINLLNIPFGTALGVYTLWALTQDEAAGYFEPGP